MNDEDREISHAKLMEIAEVFRVGRIAAELFDPEWTLVWVSDELKKLLGEDDDEELGVGEHVLVSRSRDVWTRITTKDSRQSWNRANLGFILHETPGEILNAAVGGIEFDHAEMAALEIKPAPAPASWCYEISYRRPGFPPLRINCDSRTVIDTDGTRIGVANVYAPALPATVMDLLARGDEQMYERMARLIVPGRRAAAILFADLQASGSLSRRLPSAAYFRLIRALTTAIDDAVVELGGIVGKHAGDGVTAFFLADDAGSVSKAARAALESADRITDAAKRAAEELAGEGVRIAAEDVLMNVGVHWGGALYMGQIVTGGRLEVTALGDEVNEGARIQQVARDGTTLASKAVIERLEPGDADALGIEADALVYVPLLELAGADEKSIRDAGTIAVARVGR